MDRIFAQSDRAPQVLRSLQQLYATGCLANTDYLSILPVDPGIEHLGAASFAPNPIYFDPENIGPTVDRSNPEFVRRCCLRSYG